jgi:predicted metal-binding membrane protein
MTLAMPPRSNPNLVGAIVLIAAGVYPWRPLNDVHLAQCRSP